MKEELEHKGQDLDLADLHFVKVEEPAWPEESCGLRS